MLGKCYQYCLNIGYSSAQSARCCAGSPATKGKYSYNYTWLTNSQQAVLQRSEQYKLYPFSRTLTSDELVPCCIPSLVPRPDSNELGTRGLVDVGDVLGSCNITRKTAHITWLGNVVPQKSFEQAKLLHILIVTAPGMPRRCDLELGPLSKLQNCPAAATIPALTAEHSN